MASTATTLSVGAMKQPSLASGLPSYTCVGDDALDHRGVTCHKTIIFDLQCKYPPLTVYILTRPTGTN